MRGFQNAIVVFAFCISFIWSPSLALKLNPPTLSGPRRDEINVTWVAHPEDPRFLDIKLRCGLDMERIAAVEDVWLWNLAINISVQPFFDDWIVTDGPCLLRVIDSESGEFVDQLRFDDILDTAELIPSSTTGLPNISTSALPTHSSSSISTTSHSSSLTEKTSSEHSSSVTTPTSQLEASQSTHLTTGEGTPSAQVTTERISTSIISSNDSPDTTASSLPLPAINGNHSGAIIGGTIGGVAFLCALVGLVLAYRRCRAGRVARSSKHFEGGSNSVINGIPNGDRAEDHEEDSEAIFYAPSVADSRLDSSQSISPLTSGGGVQQATSDVDRLQSEFHDPGEQSDHERVGFSAKEQLEDSGPVVDYSDSSEMEEEMFRAGVERMGRRIADIELRLQMVQQDIDAAPPGYSPGGPLIDGQSHMRLS